MTADSQWELQKSIYAVLTADAPLVALIGTRVFDHVPEDSVFPYVIIGESTASDDDTKTTDGMEQTLTLHTWSRGRGLSEIKRIMATVVDALDGVSLSVTGHTLIMIRFEFSDTLLDPDGLTRHGVQRFRAVTQSS